jgi:hypothetical protein
VPAPAVTEASWSPDALEQLVAPIALYPDQLVGQILAASVNSQEVLDAGNWLLQNQNLQGEELDAAAQKAGFGPPMRALVQFPTVVDMMCEQMDWTRQLGAAFTSDQTGMLAAVQRLRAQAAQVGNLHSTPEQKVETKTEDDKTVIEVKPADPQVIYVPQYNPQVVYTTPPPPAAPASTSNTVSTDTAVLGGLLAFGVGMAVGNAMHDDCCYPSWGAGAVYVGPRPFYPPAYAYRPAYGAAFRPAYGYRPPAGYRNSYNNVNRNVNINNNYFNQFNHNQNLRNSQRDTVAGNSATGWKGQSTYAGARDPAQAQRGTNLKSRAPQSQTRPRSPASNPRLADNPPSLSRNSAPDAGRPNSARMDRGYASDSRADPVRGNERSGLEGVRDTPGVRTEREGQRDSAFSGASSPEGGAFERAASARGNASAGGLGRASGGVRRGR